MKRNQIRINCSFRIMSTEDNEDQSRFGKTIAKMCFKLLKAYRMCLRGVLINATKEGCGSVVERLSLPEEET